MIAAGARRRRASSEALTLPFVRSPSQFLASNWSSLARMRAGDQTLASHLVSAQPNDQLVALLTERRGIDCVMDRSATDVDISEIGNNSCYAARRQSAGHKRPRSPWVTNSRRSLTGSSFRIGHKSAGAPAFDDGARGGQLPSVARLRSSLLRVGGNRLIRWAIPRGRDLGIAGLKGGTFLRRRISNKSSALPERSGVTFIYSGRQC